MNPSSGSLWDVVDALRETDRGYAREAYLFVVAALGHAAERLPEARRADLERRHLGGHELLEALVELARREFGPLAPTVFREWGVATGEDVGAIVFSLVRAGTLTARPEDTMADFTGMPDLLARLSVDWGAQPPVWGGRTGDPERSA